MERTKLYRIIASFDIFKLNRLVKYIEPQGSREHLPGQLLLKLCEDLRAQPDSITKEATWAWIQEGPYDDLRFRKICSDALQLVEKFISTEAYFGDELLEASHRLKALSIREFQPLYKTHFVRTKTLLDRYQERGSDYYFYQYQIEKNDYTVRQSNLQRFKITNIDAILSNLDTFYIIEKLKYYCEVLSRRTFLKHEYENLLIDEILRIIGDGKFSQVPLIQMYHHIILSHLEPNQEDHYFALKALLRNSGNDLPSQEMKEVYTSALNYCNRRINQGNSKFIGEAFEMYKELLSKELLFSNGQLSHWTFKNVMVLALRLGEYRWAENFIDSHKDYIPQKYRQNAVVYNRAQFYFYQQNYSRVIDLLQTIEYEDVTYNLGAKTMLFATYYELQEWEPLFALAESFKVFIHRRKNTISEGRRRSYLNLIKFTIKLQKLKHHQQGKINELLLRIEQSKEEIASVNWIKEKIKQKLSHRSDQLISRNI